jgi:hypothetical protein
MVALFGHESKELGWGWMQGRIAHPLGVFYRVVEVLRWWCNGREGRRQVELNEAKLGARREGESGGGEF